MTDTCRSCDAPIRWVRTVAGKLMPIDPDPHPDGNVAIENGKAVVHRQRPMGDDPLYLAHFATCPEADAWRAR